MRQSLLVATAILVVFIVSVGANVASVNAGRPHPLQTVGPGGCPEGNRSIQEYCPDGKTWKVSIVCRMGGWVRETNDCPTETQTETQTETAQCGAGDPPKVTELCPGASWEGGYLVGGWKTREICKNGVWQQETNPQPCPQCKAGDPPINVVNCQIEREKDTWNTREICKNGVWHLETNPLSCPHCKPHEIGQCTSRCQHVWGDTECTFELICSDKGFWENVDLGDKCSPCVIATATYGSAEAPEVQYMRYVRDNLIGSTHIGRVLVDGFNAFYYLWSPSVARAITGNEFLRAVFRVLLVPLIGIVHLAGLTFTSMTMMTGNAELASVVSFFIAALASVVAYVGLPVFFVMKMERSLRIRRRIRGAR